MTNHLRDTINASVIAASNSLTALLNLSEADKFYWHFIASCCNLVQPGTEDLTKLNTYLCIVEMLSKIFHHYCAAWKIERLVIHEIPQEITRISNDDVKDYFKWIIEMQNIMIHWQSKFINEEFTYDDIFMYAGSFQDITAFAKAVCTDHLVYSDDDIAKFKENYSKVYAFLCLLLVKSNKEYGW